MRDKEKVEFILNSPPMLLLNTAQESSKQLLLRIGVVDFITLTTY